MIAFQLIELIFVLLCESEFHLCYDYNDQKAANFKQIFKTFDVSVAFSSVHLKSLVGKNLAKFILFLHAFPARLDENFRLILGYFKSFLSGYKSRFLPVPGHFLGDDTWY